MEFDFRAELPLLLRLLVAGALAAVLGWEREAAHKPAGLTTAASIWATAAIGIAAGLGHFVMAVGSAVILLIVLRGMARFERDDQ